MRQSNTPGTFLTLTFDQYHALSKVGYELLDLYATLGVAREQVERMERSDNPDERRSASVLRWAQHFFTQKFRAAFPIQCDLMILGSGPIPMSAIEGARTEACGRVVEKIPWRIFDCTVKQGLRRQAENEGRSQKAIKRDELSQALLLALSDHDDRYPTWDETWSYIKRAAIEMAEESLRSVPRAESYHHTSRVYMAASLEGEAEASPSPRADDPVARLHGREELVDLYQRATAQQRAYIELKLRGFDDNQIESLMNVRDSTVRQMRHQLRKKRVSDEF